MTMSMEGLSHAMMGDRYKRGGLAQPFIVCSAIACGATGRTALRWWRERLSVPKNTSGHYGRLLNALFP